LPHGAIFGRRALCGAEARVDAASSRTWATRCSYRRSTRPSVKTEDQHSNDVIDRLTVERKRLLSTPRDKIVPTASVERKVAGTD